MSTVRSRWLQKYDTARGWSAKWRQRYIWHPTKHNKFKLEQWRQKAGYARRVLKNHPPDPPKGSRKGSFGIDWAWGTPDIGALKNAQVAFACRYLSHDKSKNLTAAEAKRLHDAGIDIVVVWETTANRALGGALVGAADAREAQRQAAACGMPSSKPIYFAVDFDTSLGQAFPVAEYFRAAGGVLGRSRVGVYGGYWTVKRLLDAGLVKYAWQTYAWSGGMWDKRAQLQQYSNGHSMAGVACDYNRATADDFGQW